MDARVLEQGKGEKLSHQNETYSKWAKEKIWKINATSRKVVEDKFRKRQDGEIRGTEEDS